MSYRRSEEDKCRLLKLYSITKHHYGRGVYYNGIRRRYKRYSIGTPKYKRYLRRCTNKRVRHSNFVGNHSKFKRTYDYWWNLL